MVRRKSTRVTDRSREMLNDDDRISRLPDGVIHHIYSFIDTRFAVQSSLLSSRWRNTWKSHPYLNFKIDRFTNQTNPSKFPNFVHRFLSDRDNDAEVTTIDFRSNSIKLPLLKEIITYAMSHRTQKLNIEFLGDKTRRGGFDLSLFKSRFLQDLRLSIDFEFLKTPTMTWDLPGLTSLNLESVTFTLHPPNDSKSIELFSRFSNLKTLMLVNCRLSNIDSFIIKSNTLQNLSLIDLNHHSDFIISAPKLSSFTYYGMARFSLSALDLDSLQTVSFHIIYNRALQKQPELVELMIKTFKQLRKAKFLTVNSDVVRLLSGFPELLERRCPFMSLRSLTLVEHRLPPSSIVFSDVIAYFRSSSPGLKVNIELGVAPWNIRWIDCL
ncbi:hypothetical protein L2E82_14548 [Cichorium intybus]|uniref:Uncharacterized protein n=1 Tax=Cichorium intybus TaxID=13427 RepID=A0ACB9F0A9_CICIN|nr:hypothetical protein L2E82_14548 [Cichorium intybus]